MSARRTPMLYAYIAGGPDVLDALVAAIEEHGRLKCAAKATRYSEGTTMDFARLIGLPRVGRGGRRTTHGGALVRQFAPGVVAAHWRKVRARMLGHYRSEAAAIGQRVSERYRLQRISTKHTEAA